MTLPVSIVVPIYNEADCIVDLLQLLLQQTKLPKEIVVVDSGSTDQTVSIVNTFWETQNDVTSKIEFKLVKLERSYPGRSRNEGIKQASQNWIAFIDAGIRPELNWIEELWKCVQKSKYNFSYGYCKFEACEATAAAVCALSYGYGAKIPVIPSSIFHRDVFYNVGFFREDLRSSEDIVWNKQLLRYINELSLPTCLTTYTTYYSFPDSVFEVFSKWELYEEFSVLSGTNRMQHMIYLAVITLIITGLLVWPSCILYIFFSFYLWIRIIFDMLRRSHNRTWWIQCPLGILMLVPVAMAIDFGKISGMTKGVLKKFRYVI